MHRTVLALAALPLMAAPAAAAPGSIEFCTQISEVAYSAMKVRQDGVPLHIAANHVASTLDGADLDLALGMFELAYAEPLYSSDEYKARAMSEFASGFFRICRED